MRMRVFPLPLAPVAACQHCTDEELEEVEQHERQHEDTSAQFPSTAGEEDRTHGDAAGERLFRPADVGGDAIVPVEP